jgi:tRNA-splicing ligase RtcB
MLHSGSRGVGNAIGTMFIELAKQDAQRNDASLPDRDLAYFEEGARYFGDYVRAVGWAQRFAAANREVMMQRVIEAARTVIAKPFQSHVEAVNCHHNYVQKGRHFGADVHTSRARARSARRPASWASSWEHGCAQPHVRGKGNPQSFASCLARRRPDDEPQRGQAPFHPPTTGRRPRGVECRKDAGVIDETPAAYKDIDAVMAAQSDLSRSCTP